MHPDGAGGHDVALSAACASSCIRPRPKATTSTSRRRRRSCSSCGAPRRTAASPRRVPEIVTVSYNEAGRLMDGGEHVDPVPMPAAIRAWMRAVRRRALQARAAPQGEAQRSVQGRRVRCATARRERESAAAAARWPTTPRSPERFSLTRWSQRKREPQRAAPRRAGVAAACRRDAAGTPCGVDAAPAAVPDGSPLPPVESLTFDSDFRAFMQPKVDEATQARGAEEAVQRSALQRDGRPRHLHRRLHAARPDAGGHAGKIRPPSTRCSIPSNRAR